MERPTLFLFLSVAALKLCTVIVLPTDQPEIILPAARAEFDLIFQK